MVKLLSMATNLHEHHGLFECIRPFRLRKRPCSTRFRRVFEPYTRVLAFFMIEHRGLPIVRLQDTRMIQIFCSRLYERASIRSPPRNYLCPTFLSDRGIYDAEIIFSSGSRAELNQCGPDFSVRVYDRAWEAIRSPSLYRRASAYPSSFLGTRSRSSYMSQVAGRNFTWTTEERIRAPCNVFFFFRFFCLTSVSFKNLAKIVPHKPLYKKDQVKTVPYCIYMITLRHKPYT